jgi:hypothetical protein
MLRGVKQSEKKGMGHLVKVKCGEVVACCLRSFTLSLRCRPRPTQFV